VKLSAKSMSLRDYLLLKDAANKIDLDRATYVEQRSDFEADFINYGAKAVEVAQAIAKRGAVCTDPLSMTIDSAKTDREVDAIVKEQPLVQYADAEREVERKQVEFLNVDKRMSFVPYAGVQYFSDQPARYNRAEGIVGFRLTYNFEGPDKQLEI